MDTLKETNNLISEYLQATGRTSEARKDISVSDFLLLRNQALEEMKYARELSDIRTNEAKTVKPVTTAKEVKPVVQKTEEAKKPADKPESSDMPVKAESKASLLSLLQSVKG